jgi:alpha-galactosidase
MAKIAFLGAGSIGFGRRLALDILSFPELQESTIHLVDPNQENLDFTYSILKRVIEESSLPTSLEASTDPAEALDGANYVITSIRVGSGMQEEQTDVQIPLEIAGLRQTVSDTIGIGGIFKGLRTIPAMLKIAREMEQRCPDAVLLNYTNPMAMIQWAINETTSISSVGLCHSVQHTSEQLARYMEVDYDKLRFQVGGINHMAWFTELSIDGEDLYPRLRQCLENAEVVAKDKVRFEILRHFDYFVTESSIHMSEYVPYFMKSPEEIERLDIKQRTGDTFKKQMEGREKQRKEAIEKASESTPEIKRSNEYGARIIHATETDTPCCIYGNVRNTALIPNLPDGCCVEVPCLVNREGIQPCYFGELPPQLAGLCQTNVTMQGLTVRAILEENAEYVHHAAMLDPNTMSQLSLPQIRETVDALLKAQAELMPALS